MDIQHRSYLYNVFSPNRQHKQHIPTHIDNMHFKKMETLILTMFSTFPCYIFNIYIQAWSEDDNNQFTLF